MPGRLRTTLLAAAAATMIAGCGSDDASLPADDAERLLSQLEGIKDSIEKGNCEIVESQASQFEATVAELQGDVEGDVRDTLEQAAGRLADLAEDPTQCEDASPDDGATGAAGLQTSTTAETTTTPTTTETQTTDETTTKDTDSGSGSPSTTPSGNQGPGSGPGVEVPGGGQGGQSGTIDPGTGGVGGSGG